MVPRESGHRLNDSIAIKKSSESTQPIDARYRHAGNQLVRVTENDRDSLPHSCLPNRITTSKHQTHLGNTFVSWNGAHGRRRSTFGFRNYRSLLEGGREGFRTQTEALVQAGSAQSSLCNKGRGSSDCTEDPTTPRWSMTSHSACDSAKQCTSCLAAYDINLADSIRYRGFSKKSHDRGPDARFSTIADRVPGTRSDRQSAMHDHELTQAGRDHTIGLT